MELLPASSPHLPYASCLLLSRMAATPRGSGAKEDLQSPASTSPRPSEHCHRPREGLGGPGAPWMEPQRGWRGKNGSGHGSAGLCPRPGSRSPKGAAGEGEERHEAAATVGEAVTTDGEEAFARRLQIKRSVKIPWDFSIAAVARSLRPGAPDTAVIKKEKWGSASAWSCLFCFTRLLRRGAEGRLTNVSRSGRGWRRPGTSEAPHREHGIKRWRRRVGAMRAAGAVSLQIPRKGAVTGTVDQAGVLGAWRNGLCQ